MWWSSLTRLLRDGKSYGYIDGAKREEELADAIAKREKEIVEAVRNREGEVDAARLQREQLIQKKVDERIQWVLASESELKVEEILFEEMKRG